MHFAGDVLAAPLRVPHAFHREQRRLRLHVMHIAGVLDTRIAHGRFDCRGNLLDHGRTADVLRQELCAHAGPNGKPRIGARARLCVPRKYCCVRRNHAITAAGPHHGDPRNLGLGSPAMLCQHTPKGLIRENAGEVVDPAIPFGLADDGDDLVGRKLPRPQACLQPGRVLHVLELDLGHFNRHRRFPPIKPAQRPAVPRLPRPPAAPRASRAA